MGARISLGNGLTAAANGNSLRIRLADPPYLFVVPNLGDDGLAWTGSVSIQQTMDQAPMPNNGGGVSNDGITDANADWETIITLAAGGDQTNWSYPLYRIRVLTSGITGGNPTVYMLEGIRSLKPSSPPRSRSRQMQIASD